MTAPIRSADWILDLEEPVSTLSLSPDGTRVVVLGIEGNGWVVDVVLGAILQDRGHESAARRLRRARIGGDRATSDAGESECECRQERKTAGVHEVGGS